MMRVAIQTGHYNLPSTESDKIHTALQQLDTTLPDEDPFAEVSVRAHNRYEGHPEAFTVEFQVAPAYGRALRAAASAPTSRAAIDEAVDLLERQRRSAHERLVQRSRPRRRRRRTGSAPSDDYTTPDNDNTLTAWSDPQPPAVAVHVRPAEILAMSTDDAIVKLQELDYKFLMFFNIDSGKQAVLYRRSDGDVGLIEPAD